MRKVLRLAGSRLASRVDRAFAAVAFSRGRASRRRSRAESLGHEERMEALGRIRALYDRKEFFTDPDTFFPPPAAPSDVRERRVRPFGRSGEVLDLSWPSAYVPFCEAISDRYLAHRGNRFAAARLFRHLDHPRPAAILVHGYLGGLYALEERMFPVRWLFDKGLDVALAVLPFHGVRAERGRVRPRFPSSDPRITNEGFRQAISDLRSLMRLIEARGSPAVGAMGMSLGGYSTALLATVDPRLAFAFAMIPLASIAEFARGGGRLVGTPEEQALQHQAVEEAHRVTSPLARPARIPADRILVIAGEADRITPAARHAHTLALHFGARLLTFHGGHLIQLGRGAALREAARLLAALGLLDGNH